MLIPSIHTIYHYLLATIQTYSAHYSEVPSTYQEKSMELHDSEAYRMQTAYQIKACEALQRQNTTTAKTYEHNIIHAVHGLCTLKIYRAIGNDSWCKVEMTRALLAKHEPNVGLWAGDRFEYWKGDTCLEVVRH